MNLPERRDQRAAQEEPKTGIRPRPIQTRVDEPQREAKPTAPLHFSCPACLRMMSAVASEPATECPTCGARVAPPKLVSVRAVRSQIEAPTKTGRLK